MTTATDTRIIQSVDNQSVKVHELPDGTDVRMETTDKFGRTSIVILTADDAKRLISALMGIR